MPEEARYGWGSDFPKFQQTSPRVIRASLQELIRDASPEQIRAWDDSIPDLQREVGEIVATDKDAETYTAILEYELPMESRRPDVILLVRGPVVVLELKGKLAPSQADIDQAAAYARDLRCYHSECADREVVPIVVPTRATGELGEQGGVRIVGPDALDRVVGRLSSQRAGSAVAIERFLREGAYRPLPSLVKAARELLETGELRAIHRARAATDPAIAEITRIVHDAARTSSRRLVLVTGVPGSGKTLVGLRIVHSHFLDELALPRSDGQPTAPAVFLSGNGPLVQVLQYELRAAGGGGKTFVRGVKDYVKRYSSDARRIPPEQVLSSRRHWVSMSRSDSTRLATFIDGSRRSWRGMNPRAITRSPMSSNRPAITCGSPATCKLPDNIWQNGTQRTRRLGLASWHPRVTRISVDSESRTIGTRLNN